MAPSLARPLSFVRAQLEPYDPASEPQPLRLHWTWLLILSIAFEYVIEPTLVDVWLVLQANWIRRASGRKLSLQLALAGLGLDLLWPLAGLLPLHQTIVAAEVVGSVIAVALLSVYLATIFVMRGDLKAEPIGLATGGFMTLLFGPYYFQYWLQDYVFVRLTSPNLRDTATSRKLLP